MATNSTLRAARVLRGLAQQSEQSIKKDVPAQTPQPPAKGQTPDLERRINAGWLKLWRVVYPNTPPPVQCRRRKAEGRKPRTAAALPEERRPAAVAYLSSLLCIGLALALLATGCAGPRPLKGGKAVTTRNPAGIIEQTLVQGENPSQTSKQTQETVKVRTYTLPVGSRIEQTQAPGAAAAQPARMSHDSQPSDLNPQTATAFILSAPMPVAEREESHARTELGAAQKDSARELGARLSSLKGIVWVGVGLFVFGLASLVWPPLKAIIGSVTTSAALMLGGVALMVLPSLIVGNELLILGGVVVAVGGWFLAHRHGQLRGLAAATANALGGQASPRAQTSSLQSSQGSPSQDHS
jgi:hypothetical protein